MRVEGVRIGGQSREFQSEPDGLEEGDERRGEAVGRRREWNASRAWIEVSTALRIDCGGRRVSCPCFPPDRRGSSHLCCLRVDSLSARPTRPFHLCFLVLQALESSLDGLEFAFELEL